MTKWWTLLLKTPHILVARYRGINLELTRITSCWLPFKEGVIPGSEGYWWFYLLLDPVTLT